MHTTQTRFWKGFRWSVTGLIFLLALWIVGGNLLANQQKQKIEKQLNTYVEEGLANRPQYNDSVLKLDALVAELGISLSSVSTPIDAYLDSQPGFVADETAQQEFNQIIDSYDVFEQALSDDIQPIPDAVKQYLEDHALVLENIQHHLVKSELLEWEVQKEFYTVLQEGYPSALPFPSRLGMSWLQRILLINVIDAYQQGESEAVQLGLEASWKLRQSLNDGVMLFDQLVGIVAGRPVLALMRKADSLPGELQDELVEHDYRRSLRRSLEWEFLAGYAEFAHNSDSLQVLGLNLPMSSGWFEQYLIRPYLIFTAIETYEVASEQLAITERNSNICDDHFDPSFNLVEQIAWWNIFGKIWGPSFFNQELKAIEYMLEAELTQKVLQAKTIAAQTGQWPETLPNPESYLCPDRAWKYEVMPDDTMVITFEPKPDWLKQRMENNDSLTFQFQTRKLPTVR